MNAKEARAAADIATKTKVELKSIMDIIEKAANNGEYSVLVPHIYNLKIQDSIRQLEYYLTEHNTKQDKIEW